MSLYMLWLVLSFSTIICYLRPRLSRLSTVKASLTAFVILILIQAILNEIVLYLIPQVEIENVFNLSENFRWRSLAIGIIIGGMSLHYYYLQHQWRKRTRAASQYRIEALQARIRPHFLFNSLNTVTSLIHTKPDEAEEALLDISDLFRQSLSSGEHLLPVQQELNLTRRYLHIESLRIGERLKVEWNIEDGIDDILIPTLILQPLVENAIYHGIERISGGGCVSISVVKDQQQLIITVSNPLATTDDRHHGNQIALANIQSRIETLEPTPGSVTIEQLADTYTVTIRIPLRSLS